MLVKIHRTEERKIIALCDEDLIGKKLGEDDLQLDISAYFYKGEVLSEEEILREIEKASSLNIVGQKSIAFALKYKFILKGNIIKIQNIPYALVIFE